MDCSPLYPLLGRRPDITMKRAEREMDLLKQKNWFDCQAFENEYHCDHPLGAFCSPEGTVFRLWSPTAEAVTLLLYSKGSGDNFLRSVPLTLGERGLWRYETEDNLDGTYYEYDVTVDGTTRRTADPYAKACGVNGIRSMVLDLNRTNPVGWKSDKAPAHESEDIIYELHVKDFSWDVVFAAVICNPSANESLAASCTDGRFMEAMVPFHETNASKG